MYVGMCGCVGVCRYGWVCGCMYVYVGVWVYVGMGGCVGACMYMWVCGCM